MSAAVDWACKFAPDLALRYGTCPPVEDCSPRAQWATSELVLRNPACVPIAAATLVLALTVLGRLYRVRSVRSFRPYAHAFVLAALLQLNAVFLHSLTDPDSVTNQAFQLVHVTLTVAGFFALAVAALVDGDWIADRPVRTQGVLLLVYAALFCIYLPVWLERSAVAFLILYVGVTASCYAVFAAVQIHGLVAKDMENTTAAGYLAVALVAACGAFVAKARGQAVCRSLGTWFGPDALCLLLLSLHLFLLYRFFIASKHIRYDMFGEAFFEDVQKRQVGTAADDDAPEPDASAGRDAGSTHQADAAAAEA